jgi:peptidoglycan/LPS O-acetylase OafA/YrhL
MADKIYRRDVDGLRSVAVLLVLVFHFNLFDLGKAGFLGVDIFFVISGYLISGLIWRGLEGGTFSLKAFYVRRLRRLAPALILTQMLMMAVAAIMFMPHEWVSAARENLATSLYVSNFYYWRNLDYFGLQASQSVLLHTWSLAIEEQYYLLYPLTLIAIHRFARAHFLKILLGIMALSFVANVGLVEAKPWAVFYLLPTRAWELGIGALIPFAEPRFAASRIGRQIAALVGPILIVLGVGWFGPDTKFPGAFALLPTLGSALIILAGSGAGSSSSRLLSTKLPVLIGQISYSLYLVHWPLRTIGERLLPTYGLGVRWALFALSFLLAFGLYRFVENPVRLGRVLKSSRAFVSVIAASILGLVALSLIVMQTGGLPNRFRSDVVRLAAADQDVDPNQATWELENQNSVAANFRMIGDAGQSPTWMIIGDSHAAALSGAADIWLKRRHQSALIGYRSGCLPVHNAGDGTCRAFNASVQTKIAEHPDIRDVLLISIWRQAIGETLLSKPNFEDAAFKNASRLFEARFTQTLADFRSKRVRVHIWEPLPSAVRFVPAALGRKAVFGDHWPIARAAAEHRTTFAFLHDILDRHETMIASRIDPAAKLCSATLCTVVDQNQSLYSDNNHPAWSASPYFARLLPQ